MKKISLVLSTVLVSAFAFSMYNAITSTPAYAIVSSHGSDGHTSGGGAHVSPSRGVSPSISRGSMTSIHTNTIGRSSATNTRVSANSYVARNATRTSNILRNSSVRMSTSSILKMSSLERANTIGVSNYYTGISGYGYHPLTYYYRSNNMFWYYNWMWGNSKRARKFQKENNISRRSGEKWIRVGNKVIRVPEKIYDKIKVGDHIKLISLKEIQINGKGYNA